MELMKRIEVFDGRTLRDEPVPYPVGPVKVPAEGGRPSAKENT